MEEAPTSVSSETLMKEQEIHKKKVEETQAEAQIMPQENVGSGESSGKTLEQAIELMEKGSKALKDGDLSEAAECFSRAVEIKLVYSFLLFVSISLFSFFFGKVNS